MRGYSTLVACIFRCAVDPHHNVFKNDLFPKHALAGEPAHLYASNLFHPSVQSRNPSQLRSWEVGSGRVKNRQPRVIIMSGERKKAKWRTEKMKMKKDLKRKGKERRKRRRWEGWKSKGQKERLGIGSRWRNKKSNGKKTKHSALSPTLQYNWKSLQSCIFEKLA